MSVTCLALCSLGTVAIALGCKPRATISDSMPSAASRIGCPLGTLWEPKVIGSNTPQTVDLDCDGAVDTVIVERFDSTGVAFWRIVAKMRGVSIHVTSPWEGQPELVGAVDLDADKILDLLLVVADESSIVPWPVRVGSAHPSTFPIAGSPRSYQYRFGGTPSDSCVTMAMPHVSVDSLGRGAIKLSVNSGDPTGACPAAIVRIFRLESDSLRPHSL